MATEDSNQNDELLKRYAKERREQGGSFELHPATRRLLQAEVARQFRAREPEAEPGSVKGGFIFWLGLWRGRLALGGAVAAAVVLVVWMFGPGNKREANMQLAKNDSLAVESRLMERENAALGDKPESGAAGQPSAPTLARGLALDEDRKSVEQLAKLKESQVAAVTASGSLSPVQNSPADARSKDLSDLYAKVPAQQAERYYALVPGAAPSGWARQTNAPATFAFNDSSKAYYEAGGAGEPPASFGRADGSTLFVGRYASMSSTNASAVAQNLTTIPPTALGFQPQVAYSVNPVGLGTTFSDEPSPRPELSKSLTALRGVALSSPVEKPVTLSSEPTTVAAPTPALTLAPQVDAFGVDRKLSVAEVEQKARFGSVANSAAPAGGALPTGSKGERMVFFRQSAQGLQENLTRAARRVEPARVQTDPAADKSADAPEVLSEFTVELDGDTIRVTDADQSVYEGAISNEVAVTELDASKEKEERALDELARAEKRALPKAAAPVNRAGRTYSFRAVGSNVTLKQVVIVNGRLSGADGLAGAANRTPALAGASAAPAPATAPTQMRSRVALDKAARGATAIATNAGLTIEGTVRVGATNEQRFRAVRSPR